MNADAPDLYPHRLNAVRARAREIGINHVVVYSGEDMAYLTGQRLDSHERLTALVVPANGDEPLLVLPSLELTATVRRAAGRRRSHRSASSFASCWIVSTAAGLPTAVRMGVQYSESDAPAS